MSIKPNTHFERSLAALMCYERNPKLYTQVYLYAQFKNQLPLHTTLCSGRYRICPCTGPRRNRFHTIRRLRNTKTLQLSRASFASWPLHVHDTPHCLRRTVGDCWGCPILSWPRRTNLICEQGILPYCTIAKRTSS